MKPDWKDAPEWAQWLAMDPDGDWYWFEAEPDWDCLWENQKGTRVQWACSGIGPYQSLEARP